MKRVLRVSVLLLLWSLPLSAQQLRIYHIDVEQASATLFVAPGGKTLLVDSGKNGMGSRIKAVMDRANVVTIDFFVDTHYHEDHYGGIDDLVNLGVIVREAYDRGDKDQLPGSKLSEVTFQDYQAAVGSRANHLMRGMTLPLDPLMTVTCISSDGIVIGEDPPLAGNNDENNLSISLLITLGPFRYFIGGDIQSPTEQKIADRDLVKDVDVYVADHHGSDTSSIVPFLQDLNPHVIIVSNGDNAGFHHPRQVTLMSFSQLPGPPTVFQTNKCTKGPPCGNVADEFIADPQSSDQDGTIALTADIAMHSYTVAFESGVRRIFPFRLLQESQTSEGFEGGTLSPWVPFGSVHALVSTGAAKTGTYGLAESGGSGGVYQDFSGLTPGAIYQVTAYAHAEPSSTGQALLWVHDTVGGGGTYDGWRMPSSNGWDIFSVTFVATANGRMRIHLFNSGGFGTVYWDDVHVADASGFEDDALLPWSVFGGVNASVTGSVAKTGKSSLAMTGDSGGVYQDVVGLTPGALYQVTAYAHSAPGTIGQALLWVHDTSGADNILDGWRTPSSGAWDAFAATFIATANGRMRIHLITSGGSGAIYWDDIHVVNAGSFEIGALTPWSTFGGVDASVTTSVSKTGVSSLAETGDSGGSYQDLSGLTPGLIYQIRVYARSAPGTTGQALLWVHDTVGGGVVSDGWRTPASSGWDAFTVTFVAAANGRMRIHLIFSGGSGAIYWDDVQVRCDVVSGESAK